MLPEGVVEEVGAAIILAIKRTPKDDDDLLAGEVIRAVIDALERLQVKDSVPKFLR